MGYKLAVGSWAYAFGPYADDPIPLDQVIRRLSALKFDGVELNGFAPHAHPDLYPTKDSRRQFVDFLAAQGLEACGYAPDFSAVPPAVAAVKEYEGSFRRYLEFCVDCGIPKLRIDTVSEPGTVEVGQEAATMERIATIWRRCAQIAQDAGILLIWEFEPGFVFNKPSQIVNLVHWVDHPNFQILFDSCHAHLCASQAARHSGSPEYLAGGEVELARLLHGKIGQAHLIDSDNTLHDGLTSTHAPFGQGVIDFDRMVPAILQAGYQDPWWTIDLCFWPDAWEVTAAAKRFVDNLLPRYLGEGVAEA